MGAAGDDGERGGDVLQPKTRRQRGADWRAGRVIQPGDDKAVLLRLLRADSGIGGKNALGDRGDAKLTAVPCAQRLGIWRGGGGLGGDACGAGEQRRRQQGGKWPEHDAQSQPQLSLPS